MRKEKKSFKISALQHDCDFTLMTKNDKTVIEDAKVVKEAEIGIR